MAQRRSVVFASAFVALLTACSSDATPAAAPVDEGPPVECRGTSMPERDVVNPDDPTFSDSNFTNEQVREMFAKSRANNAAAYRSYSAAKANADVLSCAFCSCGCSGPLRHMSALDCFKDMHGFT